MPKEERCKKLMEQATERNHVWLQEPSTRGNKVKVIGVNNDSMSHG